MEKSRRIQPTEEIINGMTGVVATATTDYTAKNLFDSVRKMILQILKSTDWFDENNKLKPDVLSVRMANYMSKAGGFDSAADFIAEASNEYNHKDIAVLLTRYCFMELFATFQDANRIAKISDIKFMMDTVQDSRNMCEKLVSFFGYIND